MALKSDNLGFLMGEPVDWAKAISIWNDIRADVAAIRSAMGANQAAMNSVIKSKAANDSTVVPVDLKKKSDVTLHQVAQKTSTINVENPDSKKAIDEYLSQIKPRERDASGRFIAASKPSGENLIAQEISKSAASNKSMLEKIDRAANGRFLKRNEVGDPDGGTSNGGLKHLKSAAVMAVDAGKSMMSQDFDPTIAAANEMKSLLAPVGKIAIPMARGAIRLGRSGAAGVSSTAAARTDNGSDMSLRIEKRKLAWYQQIWGALTDIRRGDEDQGKAIQKKLDALGDRTKLGAAGNSSSGVGSFLGMLLAPLLNLLRRVPVIGGLIPSFGSAPKKGLVERAKDALGVGGKAAEIGANSSAAGGAVAAEAGVAVKSASKLGRLAGGAGKLLKKVPILGTLLTLGGMAMDANATEADSTLTDDQKKDRHIENVSGTAGSVGGMAGGAALGATIGTFILPGVGTVIGGLLGGWLGSVGGEIVGKEIGGWVNDLRKSDMPKRIMSTWNSMTELISSGWNSAVMGISSTWDAGVKKFNDYFEDVSKTVSKTFGVVIDAVKGFLKDKFGLDIDKVIEDGKKKASEIVDGASKKVGIVKDAVIEKATQVKEASAPIIEKGKDAIDGAVAAAANTRGGRAAIAASSAIVDGARSSGNWILGQTSKMFESGKAGAGAVSTGRGDNGGVSYGTYQLSSKAGTVDKFLSSTSYGDTFKGLKPGTKEFSDKWKDVAKTDPKFESAQHDFIKSTHYDPAMSGLKKSGIDLSDRGSAVKDAIWSTSTQFGAGSDKSKTGAVSMVKSALGDKDLAKMSDADIVSAIQDYKIKNNDVLFASSSKEQRAGTLARASKEKDRLLELASYPSGSLSKASTEGVTTSDKGSTPESAIPLDAAIQPTAATLAKQGAIIPDVSDVSAPKESPKDVRRFGMTYDNSEFASLYKKKDGTQNTPVLGGESIADKISDKGIDPMSQDAMFAPSLPGAAPKYSEPLPPSDVSKRSFAPIPYYEPDEDDDDEVAPTKIGNSAVTNYGESPILSAQPVAVPSMPAMPSIPEMPKMPAQASAIPEAPSSSVMTQIYGSEKQSPLSVKVDKGDIGQDIKDRGIAHIATGGIGGNWRGG
ncbi:VgrG-related protein [Undibacterium crateris]|uniref:VgrG-related protein n=1 Tax=Undibacterium crateris TaxID=2528175 RepID=UPI001389F3E8|nr:hypothetical protein [Undibacterium crateris]NDI85064.1 hypothetical protein [Undibacterium crateris]